MHDMKKAIKKLTLIIAAAALLSSCGSADSSVQTTEAAAKAIPEKVVHVQSDIIVYSDLNSLLDASDLIVIGEFSADAEQEIEYQYNPEFGKDVIVDGESVNTLHISKVLKGAPASEEIKIVQSYFVQDEPEQLVSFSGLTPMVRGEEWLFFLRYDKEKDNYWCAGDYCGRYPVPNEEIKAKLDEIGEQGLLDKKTLGIYDDSENNTYLYRDIIEYFGDRLTD